MIRFESPADAKLFGEILLDAGFRESELAKRLNLDRVGSPKPEDLPVFLLRLGAVPKLGVMVRLLTVNEPVTRAEAEDAFAPLPLETILATGLLRVAGDGRIESVLKMMPFGDYIVVCDREDREGEADYVMGNSSSSTLVYASTVRRPVKRMLDLCAGSGFQALSSPDIAETIVATDLNERAVMLGEFAAAINGADNITYRTGSLYEPVAGETFDLITANLPLVISPEMRFVFRDGGPGICERGVRQTAQHLNEGGWASIGICWTHRVGADWLEEIAGWLEGSGCDGLLLKGETMDVPSYASHWLWQTDSKDEASFRRRHVEWVAYFESEGISHLGMGSMLLHKVSSRPNWFDTDDYPAKWFANATDQIERMFAVRTLLHSPGVDEELLKLPLRISPTLRLVQTSRPGTSKWEMYEMMIHTEDAMRFEGRIDPAVLGILTRCNGATPLGSIIQAFAESVKAPIEKVMPAILPLMKAQLERGYLLLP